MEMNHTNCNLFCNRYSHLHPLNRRIVGREDLMQVSSVHKRRYKSVVSDVGATSNQINDETMRRDSEKNGCFLLEIVALSSKTNSKNQRRENVNSLFCSSSFETLEYFDSDRLLFLVSFQRRFVDFSVST